MTESTTAATLRAALLPHIDRYLTDHTLADLAELSGIAASTISSIRTGARTVGYTHADALAQALNLNLKITARRRPAEAR